MLKIYLLLIVLGVLGGVGYGAVAYYNDTQQRIQQLSENNAKLESAVATAEASLQTIQDDIQRVNELNSQLQSDLQKAEAYGDELRNKLRQHDLTALAIKKPGLLEGKMNGATAKLWRELEGDTGGSGDRPLPEWLQSDREAGTGDQGSNPDRENNGTDSPETEASPAS